MGFFTRFRRQQEPPPNVKGLLGYYGLGEWWLTSFASSEREDMEGMWGWVPLGDRPLTRGQVTSNPLSPGDFLVVLSHRTNGNVKRRILAKARELRGGNMPGHINGKQYTVYMNQAKQLIQDGKLQQADPVVDKGFTAYEDEWRVGLGASLTEYDEVPPAPYWDFAVLYRKQKDYAREVGILERYVRQPRKARGVPDKPDKYLERLEKARILLYNATQNDPRSGWLDKSR